MSTTSWVWYLGVQNKPDKVPVLPGAPPDTAEHQLQLADTHGVAIHLPSRNQAFGKSAFEKDSSVYTSKKECFHKA